MSIAVLSQVYGECRRLAAAGSGVARGDFRLKKLLPPLDAAGAKAPVFARVAEAARTVTDGPEDAAAGGLLELTALVTAVLYTQGDTAVPGELQPVESVNLGGAANVSARLLKPLLEALTTTGSGRLERVKEAHEQGAFADLRLVGPAVAGLDDPYAEVADFLADTVIPAYGPAAGGLVRAKYDPQGGAGNARRLRLLHKLDPEGSRELVREALDGSKDVRVAAVACLGPDDLPTTLLQVASKNKEVRAAAYEALARLDHPDALAAVAKGLAGKDYQAAAWAVRRGDNPAAVPVLAAAVQSAAESLDPKATKKAVSEAVGRLETLLRSLPAGPAADAVLRDLFARRVEFKHKLKGDGRSGADLNAAVVQAMAGGSAASKRALAAAHADLEPAALESAARAGRSVLSPAEFFDTFGPYLGDTHTPGRGTDTPREAVLRALTVQTHYYHWLYTRPDQWADLDPRWQDAAVEHRLVGLARAVGRVGHRPTEALLTSEFEDRLKTSKSREDLPQVLGAMVHLRHPDAAACLARVVEREAKLTSNNLYWYTRMIPDLPKDALPTLEAAAAKLPARERDVWVQAVEELREKTDGA